MLYKTLKFILTFLSFNFLIAAEITWRSTLNNYLNVLNLILIIFIFLSCLNPKEPLIRWAIYSFFIIDLFNPTPFGQQSFSLFISLLTTNWLLLNVFTDRSFYMVLLSGFFATIIYRLFYICLSYFSLVIHGVYKQEVFFSVKELLINASVNTAALGIIYAISWLFLRRLHPQYVTVKYL